MYLAPITNVENYLSMQFGIISMAKYHPTLSFSNFCILIAF